MRRKTIIICILTVLLCLVSGLLPEIVLGLRDRALAAKNEDVSVDEVQLSLLTEMDAVEKLQTAGASSGTSLYLTTGRTFTRSQALEAAWNRGVDMGLLNMDLLEYETDLSPELRVTADGSGLLLWRVTFLSDAADLEMLLDDEEGFCLGYRQTLYLLGKAAWEKSLQDTESAPQGEGEAESSASAPDDYPIYESGGDGRGQVWVKDSTGKRATYKLPVGDIFYEYFYDHSGDTAASPELFYYAGARLLDPLGLTWDQTYTESDDTVMVYVPQDDEYYLLPVTVRADWSDQLSVPLRVTVAVNMG